VRHALPLYSKPELERARLSMRADICRDCPQRTNDGKPFDIDHQPACEKNCEVFKDLPTLLNTAKLLDPMVGSFERAMRGRIHQYCDRVPPRDPNVRRPLLRHCRRIIRVLAKIVGH